MRKFLFTIPILVTTLSAICQGDLFYKNFARKDYGNAHFQNWQTIQDQRGIIFIANDNGVLEYDGVKWNLIELNEGNKCRSLGLSKTGRIYVGGLHTLGYMEATKKGQLSYKEISLENLSEEEIMGLDLVKYIRPYEGVVYFFSDRLVLEYSEKEKKITKKFPSKQKWYSIGDLNGELLLYDISGEAFLLTKGELKPLDWLSSAEKDNLIATHQNGENLYCLRSTSGLLKININTHQVDTILSRRGGAYRNKEIKDFQLIEKNSKISLQISGEGLVIIDLYGKEWINFNKEKGLINEFINNVFEDRNGDLWLCTNNGISFLENSSKIRKYKERQGIKNTIESIQEFAGKLVVGSESGIIFKAIDSSEPFQSISTNEERVWNLNKIVFEGEEYLFASFNDGLYELKPEMELVKITSDYPWSILYNPLIPDYLFELHLDGVELLQKNGDTWLQAGPIKALNTEFRFGGFTGDSIIWLANNDNLLVKYSFNANNPFDGKKVICDSTFNKKNKSALYPMPIGDSLLFIGSEGIFTYKNNLFSQVKWFNDTLFGKAHRISNDDKKGIWVVHYNDGGKFRISHIDLANGFKTRYQDFESMNEDPTQSICVTKNSTWFGGTSGLFEVPNNIIETEVNREFQALFRRISLKNDSLLFAGAWGLNEMLTGDISKVEFAPLAYSYNDITFEVASNSYSQHSPLKFSYYLEGFDKGWSNWNEESFTKYTNLNEGDYVMRVRVKNSYDQVSEEASFSFKVLPPWWRTWWFLTILLICFVFAIYLFVKWREGALREKARQLSLEIQKATREIRHQKEEVEKAKHVIEEKHKEITDSINYAERIQRSFLATKEILDQNLPNYFVLFKPKDVVSGDFYWASKLSNGRFALVTADSTGHGVPGAIMSILNITSLESAVTQGLLNPSEILNQTRENIVERLKKDGSVDGGKDGMDCSLCIYDLKNNKLAVAAANNPVWIVRDGEVIEIKSDKMPVGKHDKQHVSFTQHEIDLKKGDIVYTLTDGYPDQFGGEVGKKFMIKKLRELIIANSSLPLEEQKSILNITFNNWVGGLEQVDDVTIVAVQV